MTDHTIDVGGRAVGFADFGPEGGTPVLWCHGGPGSRLEPAAMAGPAAESGVRVIGIDRPGYGLSDPWPGRTIGAWVPDGIAVADALGIDRFITVGMSTGGAYALALAAAAPGRVIGTVAACALSDMRWEDGKAAMGPETHRMWGAKNREEAIAEAVEQFGEDGSKLISQAGSASSDGGPGLPEADVAMFTDAEWLAGFASGMQAMFAHGVQGYADDRLADGPGWGSFAVDAITTPVIVVHGGSDSIVPVAHAHHTAAIVPGADLRVFSPLGHFSIATQVLPAVLDLR